MDKLFWFMFLARPKPGHPDFSRVTGVVVTAWVAQPDEPSAEHIAREAIEAEHWQVVRLEEWAVVSRESYRYSPESLTHFERAIAEGHSLVFHPWPQ